MEQQGLDIFSLLRRMRRRLPLALGIFLVGAVLSAGIAYVLPPVYESTARILVESQQIPDELARSTVTASAAERLQLIEQRLLTRRNVLEIAERIDLFTDRPNLSPTEKVEAIREATTFQAISFNDNPRYRGPQVVSAFLISFRNDSAVRAARVANEFVSMALEQNLRTRTTRATETLEFFSDEVQRLGSDLLALETEIAGYKESNKASLPETLEFRLQELTNIQQQQFERDQRRAQLESERRAILEALESGGLSSLIAGPPTPAQRELAILEAQQAQKSSLYSPSHPEMRSLNARIAALEKKVAADHGVQNDASSADGEASNRENPQIELLDSQIALIDAQLEDVYDQQARLQESITETPKTEMALNALNRRYADLQLLYQTAVAKQAEAQTGEKLEINNQAESFEVIEQALVPEKPIAPNRALIAVGGTLFSLGLGLGLAFLLALANDKIVSAKDLERRLQIRPIVVVPTIRTKGEALRRRLRWILLLGLGLATLAGVLFLVDLYVLPLELIAERIMERSGLGEFLRNVTRRL
ncbi:MAG: hypothetical protein Kilf2KO_06390 [Rhodospirillales bacterium]